MKIIHRYIAKNIISTILLVTVVLIALDMFIEFSNQFADLGQGNYGFFQVFLYVLLQLPRDIYQFIPIAGLLGSIIGLGLLASRSELIVMRAAGISLIEITVAVLKGALVVIALAVVLGEIVAPVAERNAVLLKTNAMSQGQAIFTGKSAWIKANNSFINIQQIKHSGHLRGITRYQFDNNYRLQKLSYAKEAVYQNKQWIFNGVTESDFANNKISTKYFSKQKWDFTFKPHLLSAANINSEDRSLLELHAYIKYLRASGLQYQQSQFDFWQRIFQPLAALIMVLLAVPFIFGPLRTVTMGLRILAGTAVGVGFYLINQFVGPFVMVSEFQPFLAAILPTLLVSILATYLLIRAR